MKNNNKLDVQRFLDGLPEKGKPVYIIEYKFKDCLFMEAASIYKCYTDASYFTSEDLWIYVDSVSEFITNNIEVENAKTQTKI